MTCSVQRLRDLSMVTGIKMTDDVLNYNDGKCEVCLKEKTTQNMILKKSDVENPRRLHRIYSDVCGPFNVEGYSQCRYFVTFIDGFFYYMRVKPIKSKNEVPRALMEWIT